jgi:hypothetical protein
VKKALSSSSDSSNGRSPDVDFVKKVLKERCTSQTGVLNRGMALMALNFAQKEADPQAYEP